MEILIICKGTDNEGLIAGIRTAYEKTLTGKKPTDSDLKVVCSSSQWVAFKAAKSKLRFVFIQPELDWNATSYFGYEVAFELLSDEVIRPFFDLRFISGLMYETLLNGVSVKYRCLIEAFTHYNDIKNKDNIDILVPSYSQVHFDLMRTLITNNINRLNLIQHEVQSIQANIQQPRRAFNIEGELTLIYKQLEELEMIDLIPAAELSGIKRRFQSSGLKKQACIDLLELLGQKIRLAHYRLLSDFTAEVNPINKSKYKVVIIEDSENWRRELSGIFGEYFSSVYPATKEEVSDFKTADARQIIHKFEDADIFVLDLLYKDISGFWFHFNGLDLYDLIKRKHPYAAVRIISNLPRDMVAELSGVVTYPIHFSHVFPKRDGYIGAKSVIQNRLLELIQECSVNEKMKSAFKPIPNTGFFKWDGMRTLLHALMTTERKVYLEHRMEATRFFELFKLGKLNVGTEGWNSGELMTQRMEAGYTKSFVVNKLTALFTHRLLLIYKAIENDRNFISCADYQSAVLTAFTKLSKFDTSYFYKTGFHYEVATDEYSAAGYIIHFNHLFPEEYQFIETLKKEKGITERESKLAKFPELQQWATELFARPSLAKNWGLLQLDFSPYTPKPDLIRKDLTVKQLKNYLLALFAQYEKPEVEDMIMETISYEIRKSLKVPEEIRTLVDDLCQV